MANTMWEHPVGLVTVYFGFYLSIVFLSLSIGERRLQVGAA